MRIANPRNPDEQQPQPEPEEEIDHFDIDEQYRAVKMPTVYSFVDEKFQKTLGVQKIRPTLQHVITTEQFHISDMQVYDTENKHIITSIVIYKIKPHSQLLPLKMDSPVDSNKNELLAKRLIYFVLSGRGSINVEGFAKPIYTSDIIPVEEGVRHTFVNAYDDPMTLQCFYDGELDPRDKYKRNEKRMKQSKESMQKIFNARTQQVEERPIVTEKKVPPEPKQEKLMTEPKPAINRTVRRFSVKPESKHETSNSSYETEPTSVSDDKFA